MSKKTDPVLDAVMLADIIALRNALADKCDPNRRDRAGRTPLANAVLNEDLGAVETLIGAGADTNAADSSGCTPLHHAAQRQSVAIVDALLAAGAAVDPKDSFGNTPLFKAVFESRGRSAVLLALLKAGADMHSSNNSGVSPRELAASIASFDVLSLFSFE
jgi:uncharacterized protein